MLRKFVVEREIVGLGNISDEQRDELTEANSWVLNETPGVQWQYSYVGQDRCFSVYLAESAQDLFDHAAEMGVPITRITEIVTVVDRSGPDRTRRVEALYPERYSAKPNGA